MSTPLRVREDGSFTIVQLTDLHWCTGDDDDLLTRALMERVLDEEQPDLVVITGDLLGGDDCHDAALGLREVAQPMVDRNLPWAAVLGNHDDESTLTRPELMEQLTALPGCLAIRGPEGVSGIGNYALSVEGRQGEATWNLFFLDSNAYAEDGLEGYGWIRHDQIAWFLERLHGMRAEQGARRPALCFFHIPLPEWNEVWDDGMCVGVKQESVCCPRLNSGFFSAMHSTGDVIGAFVGHDHINDYAGSLHGVKLCFGRASGYGTYGKKGFERGARVIRFQDGARHFETWLRLADGQRVEQKPQG